MQNTKVYLLDLGYMRLDKGFVIPNYNPAMVVNPNPEHQLVNLPVYSVLIDHPEGKILFDTGVNPNAMGENGRWGEIDQKIAPYYCTEEQHLVNRLEELNVRPKDIKYVVTSHLHADHAGSLELFTESTILVHDEEFRNTLKLYAINKGMGTYCWNDIDVFIRKGLNWKTIGSDQNEVELVEGVKILNYGSSHSWGMLGMHIDLPGNGGIILSSDTVYTSANYGPPNRPSGFDYDTVGLSKAVTRIRDLQQKTNSQVWFGHDEEQFKTLIKSTEGFYEELSTIQTIK